MPGVGSIRSNASQKTYDSDSSQGSRLSKDKLLQADESYIHIRTHGPVVPKIAFTNASPLFGAQDEKWVANIKLTQKFVDAMLVHDMPSLPEKYAWHSKANAISAAQTAKNEEDIHLGNALVFRALTIIELLDSSSTLDAELRGEIYAKWNKLILDIKDYKDSAGTPLDIPKCQLLIGLELLNKSLSYTVGFAISTWGWALSVGLLVVSNIMAVTTPFIISTLAALLKAGTWFWADLAKKEERNAQEIHDDIFNPLIHYLETIIAMFPADGRDSEQKMLLVGQAEQNKKLDSHTDALKHELAKIQTENKELKDKMDQILHKPAFNNAQTDLTTIQVENKELRDKMDEMNDLIKKLIQNK